MEDLLRKYATLKVDYTNAKALADNYKKNMDGFKEEMRAKLEEMGLKSAKTDLGTAAMVSKSKMAVVDDRLAIEWLKDQPDLESDLYIKLDKRGFEPLIKKWFEKTGEIVPGTETRTTEYLSIKGVKK